MNRVTGALLAGLLLVQAGAARAADPPPAGNWKVVLPFQGGASTMWLVTIETKNGKLTGTAIKNPELQRLPEATVEDLTVSDGAVKFTLKTSAFSIPFEGKVEKDGEKIRGTVTIQGKVNPARLERTSVTSFDPFELSKETFAKKAGEAEGVGAALELLSMAAENKAKPEDVRTWADKAVEWSNSHGPAWQNEITLSVSEMLEKQDGFADLAVDYARKAEKALAKGDKPAYQRRVLQVLAAALTKAKKDDEAKAVNERRDKIAVLSVAPYAGRKGNSERVAVVELFTGAECPPCVTADLAFDALTQSYKPTDVIFLEYHLHIPGPDPMTNKGSLERKTFYGKAVEGAPTMFINGKLGPAPGGRSEDEAQDVYDAYTPLLKETLEKPAKAKLKAQAVKKDGKIVVRAEASDLEETGPDVRLRLALVEEKIDYTGGNKVSEHHDVVRGFVGDGPEGTPLPDKTGRKVATIDLDDVRKEIKEYMKSVVEGTGKPFTGKEPSVDLKKVRLVAFVQNDETSEILQAVQIDLPTE
jgi:hypothetical protein